MQYRKKPVVVEAYKTDKEIVIHTLEGDMKASIGDYIITGVNGEKYPCKPDIFEKTYEEVTNTNYDRIKSMSDEDLATLINRIVVCHHLRNEWHCEKCPIYPAKPCNTECIIDWLKQEVSE